MRFHFADCVLDSELFELSRGGERVAVQPKVLELLLHLVENRDRVVKKRELLDTLWQGVSVSESSLTRAVSLARAAVGERDGDARLISTVRGRGYRLLVPVRTEEAAAQESPLPATHFVCREPELAIAREAFEAASAGRGQVLVLVGEPGIGKSRLAAEIADLAAARGAQVLWGRCHERDDRPGYWPWQQLLRAGLELWGADAFASALGPAAPDVAAILPELRERLPELPAPAGADPAQARFRLFDGVTRLLRARAIETPLALVLDDLHGADEPSLALLGFLSHELTGARILAVGTYRDHEAAGSRALQQTLVELARTQRPRNRLVLRGLGPECVERLMRAELGAEPDAALLDECLRRSEGNPLFLLELVHWLESRGPSDELPEGIRQVIGRRLAQLGEPCLRALEAAAVAGREFALGVAAHAAGVTEDEMLARLARAERGRVVTRVRGRPGLFRFAHVLFEEVLCDGLDTERRALLHRRVGESLEELYLPQPIARTDFTAPIPGPLLAALARHFSEAAPGGDARHALDYCARAGDCAMSVHAYLEAAQHFARALTHLPLVRDTEPELERRLWLGLADAEFCAGRNAEAGRAIERAVARARVLGDAALLGEAAIRVSQFKIGGDLLALVPARVSLLEEARAAQGESDSPLSARILVRLVEEMFWSDDPERADQLVTRATEIARRCGDKRALCEVLTAHRLYRLDPRTRAERGRVGEELITLAREMGSVGRELLARVDFRLCDLVEGADADGFDREIEQVARLAEEARLPAFRWMASRARTARALWQGKLREAESLLAATLALGDTAVPDVARLSHSTARLALRRMQGRFAELGPELTGGAKLSRTRGHRQAALALLYTQLGRAELARRALDEVWDKSFSTLRRDSNFAYNLALLTEACVALGERERCEALYELLEPFAGSHLAIQSIVTAGCASRFLGLIDAHFGRLAAAESHLLAAVAVEQRMRAAPHEVWARRDLAGVLERRGQRAAARAQRKDADALAGELGLAE